MRLPSCSFRFTPRSGAAPLQRRHVSHTAFTRPSPKHHDAARTLAVYRTQTRGKKTKTSTTLTELPQGVIPLEPLALEQADTVVYPTVVQQARKHMREFENCVLLTRVGGFYELYFEHAEEYGPLLNLKVAKKEPKNAPPYSMV